MFLTIRVEGRGDTVSLQHACAYTECHVQGTLIILTWAPTAGLKVTTFCTTKERMTQGQGFK